MKIVRVTNFYFSGEKWSKTAFLDALASLELDMTLRGYTIFREISVKKIFGHTDITI